MLALAAALIQTASEAWVRDTHDNLTFAAALSTCYDWHAFGRSTARYTEPRSRLLGEPVPGETPGPFDRG
jgi:hypothetical protein